MISLLTLLCFSLLGVISGVISGLLGVGGGIIIIPGLLMIFHYEGFHSPILMHLAVATSFAVMVPTTIRSFMAHRKHGIDVSSLIRFFLPALITGVVIGAIAAHFIHSHILRVMFSVFLLLLSVQMLAPNQLALSYSLSTVIARVAGFFIGLLSSMIGVSGSTFTTPLLLGAGMDIREVMSVSISVGIVVSCCSTFLYAFTGLHASGMPPYSLGYIYWPAALSMSIMTLTFAPLGVRLSHKLPRELLRKLFAVLLAVIALHGLWAIFAL